MPDDTHFYFNVYKGLLNSIENRLTGYLTVGFEVKVLLAIALLKRAWVSRIL